MSMTEGSVEALQNDGLSRIALAARQALDDRKLLLQHTLDDVVENGVWLIIDQPMELFEAAERRARAELALAPGSAAARARLARCLRWLGNEKPWHEQEEMAQEAERLCAEAVSLDEKDALARLEAAALLLRKAWWETDDRAEQSLHKAIYYCDRVLYAEPGSYVAKSLRARALTRQALLAPTRADAVNLYEQALRELQEALEARADFYPALASWGFVLLNLAKFETDGPEAEVILEESETRFQAALAIYPLYEEALNGLANVLTGRAKFFQGQEADSFYGRAFGIFEKAVTARPHSFYSLTNWGNSIAAQARHRGGPEARRLCTLAADKYNSALTFKPDNPFTLAQLGSLHLFEAYEVFGAETQQLGEKAHKYIRKALELQPDFSWTRSMVSAVLRLRAVFMSNQQAADNFKRAIDNCGAALSRRTDNPVAIEEWVRVLRAQADRSGRSEAISLLRVALAKVAKGRNTWPKREGLMLVQAECLAALAERQTWRESALTMNEAVGVYNDALGVWPHNYDALRGAGKALVFLARRAGEHEVDSAFERAYEKFSEAQIKRPGAHTVLADWGDALRLHAERRPGMRERLLRESEEKLQSALSMMPGHLFSQVTLAATLVKKALMTWGTGRDEILDGVSRLLKAASESQPPNPYMLCTFGNILAQQAKRRSLSQALGLHTEALASFDRALQIRPDFAWALESSGWALIEQARIVRDGAEAQRLYSAADERFRDALQLEPDRPGRLIARAQALGQRARRSPYPEALRLYEEAYQLFREADEVWPESAVTKLYWANTMVSAALQAHDNHDPRVKTLFADVEVLFITAQLLDDTNWEIYRDRALALIARAGIAVGADAERWYSEAAGLLERALSLNAVPELILVDRANLFLARAQQQLPQLEREAWHGRALADLREAVGINPGYDDALYALARALHNYRDGQKLKVHERQLQGQELIEADGWYARAHTSAPFREEILLDWARLLKRQQQYSTAKEKAQGALALTPDNADAHRIFAETLRDEAAHTPNPDLSLPRLGEAEAHLREAIQLRPDAASLHVALADTLTERAGKTEAKKSTQWLEEAAREYEQAMMLEPGVPEWPAGRAGVFSRLADLDPSNFITHLNHALADFKLADTLGDDNDTYLLRQVELLRRRATHETGVQMQSTLGEANALENGASLNPS